MNTSAHLASRSTIFAASGDLRSIATPRLLRLFRCHMYGYLDCGCGGILFPILHNSPLGGSTLITSAPKSDRITAAPGPAMKLARSTTFTPEKIFSVVIDVSSIIRNRCRDPANQLLRLLYSFLTDRGTVARVFRERPRCLPSCLHLRRRSQREMTQVTTLRTGSFPNLGSPPRARTSRRAEHWN